MRARGEYTETAGDGREKVRRLQGGDRARGAVCETREQVGSRRSHAVRHVARGSRRIAFRILAGMSDTVSVCFVCLGNICRSPTAEGIFKAMVTAAGIADRVRVESAGTGAWHLGEPADERARAAARARGLDLDGTARQFSHADFERLDYVLSMDTTVLAALRRLARTPAERAKVRNFRSFDPASPDDAAVPDPYYGGADGFEEVFDICEAACRGLLDAVKADLDGDAGAR